MRNPCIGFLFALTNPCYRGTFNTEVVNLSCSGIVPLGLGTRLLKKAGEPWLLGYWTWGIARTLAFLF